MFLFDYILSQIFYLVCGVCICMFFWWAINTTTRMIWVGAIGLAVAFETKTIMDPSLADPIVLPLIVTSAVSLVLLIEGAILKVHLAEVDRKMQARAIERPWPATPTIRSYSQSSRFPEQTQTYGSIFNESRTLSAVQHQLPRPNKIWSPEDFEWMKQYGFSVLKEEEK